MLSQVSLLLAGIGVLGSIFGFYLRDLADALTGRNTATFVQESWGWAYLGFMAVNLVCLARSVYFLVRSLHGYTYRQPPSPRGLRDHYDQLLAYHDDDYVQAEHAFQEFLAQEYVEAAHEADANNLERKKHLFLCARSTVWSLVFLAATILPFLGHKSAQPKKPLEIRMKSSSALDVWQASSRDTGGRVDTRAKQAKASPHPHARPGTPAAASPARSEATK